MYIVFLYSVSLKYHNSSFNTDNCNDCIKIYFQNMCCSYISSLELRKYHKSHRETYMFSLKRKYTNNRKEINSFSTLERISHSSSYSHSCEEMKWFQNFHKGICGKWSSALLLKFRPYIQDCSTWNSTQVLIKLDVGQFRWNTWTVLSTWFSCKQMHKENLQYIYIEHE